MQDMKIILGFIDYFNLTMEQQFLKKETMDKEHSKECEIKKKGVLLTLLTLMLMFILNVKE